MPSCHIVPGGTRASGVFVMFRRVLKPAARAAASVSLTAVAATTLALLPVTAAYAGSVTAATPSVVANTGSPTIAFTTQTAFNNAVPPQVTLTDPSGASYQGQSVNVSGQTVSATFAFGAASPPPAPGAYAVEICQTVPPQGACSPNADDKAAASSSILTVTASAPSVSSLSTPVRATNASTSTKLTIQGFNFAAGDSVAFVPVHAGDMAPTLTGLNIKANSITGTLGSLTNATPNAVFDVVVTDTSSQSSTKSAADQLTVVPPPTIASVVPAATVGLGAGQGSHPARTLTFHTTALDPTHAVQLSLVTGSTDGLVVALQSVTQSTDPNVTDVVATVSTTTGSVAKDATLMLTDTVTGGSTTQTITVTPAPTITSAAPAAIGQGGANGVDFVGAGLEPDATITFPASSKVSTVGTQPPVDATKQTITLTVDVDQAAPTGKVPFSVTNGDGGATDYTGGANGTSVFTVNAAPVLQSVSPPSVALGATNQTLTLNGTGFTSSMKIAPTNQNSGVQFTNLSVPNGSTTQATVQVTVANNAPTGPIAITLSNPDAGTSNSIGKLSIDSFGVNGITPGNASNGGAGASAVALTIGGAGIPTTGTTQLQLTRLPESKTDTTSVPPITVSPTSVTSTTWKGTVNLVGAAAGHYQVQLINGSDTGTCSCQFTVNSAGAPTVTSVTPSAVAQGVDTTLVIAGTGFTRGTTVTFGQVNNADSVTPAGPTVFDSPTKLEVPVHVAASAPTGSSNKVDVIDTNGGPTPNTGTCTGCLTINPAPTITSFSPTALAQGATSTLTITGTNFDANTATVSFGTGISQAAGATTISATQIKIPVKVDQAAPASVPVTVRNGDSGSGSKNITVNAGPKISSISPPYVAKTFTGTLTITGSGYHSGATVSFPAGSNVATNGNPTVSADGSTISVPIKVTRTDAAQVDVTVTNSDDQGSATLAKGLGVAIAPQDPTGVTASRNNTGGITVSWTPVATSGNGGAPITNYTVSVTDPANSGISNQTTTGNSVTFTGLSGPTDYTFKVVATNAANLSSPGATASSTGPLAGTQLTLISTAGHIVAGQRFSLGGTLSSGAGDPIGGATITLLGRNDAGQTSAVGTTTTSSDGHWLMSPAPKHNTTYAAVFAGNAQFAKATSTPGSVTVAPKVTISGPQLSNSATKLVITGAVSPNKAGRTVHLTAVSSRGVKKDLGMTVLSGRSTYTFKVKLGKGKWTLVVRIGRTSGNTAGHSNGKSIKRT